MIVPVPEAEPLVGRWRAVQDHSAINGAPAHITLLVPFVPVEELGDAVPRLREVLAGVGPTQYVLAHVGVFPHVSWLAPEPATLFRDLTARLMAAFPDCVPYGGAHRHVVPHLTVIDGTRIDASAEVHLAFAREADAVLPIEAEVAEVQVLVEDVQGRWVRHVSITLA